MTKLVSLEQAKTHLKVDWDADDEDIESKIEEASEAVLTYLRASNNHLAWIDTSGTVAEDSSGPIVPANVRAATLQMLTALYENRGDDGGEASKFTQGYLPPVVTALLYSLRDPALA